MSSPDTVGAVAAVAIAALLARPATAETRCPRAVIAAMPSPEDVGASIVVEHCPGAGQAIVRLESPDAPPLRLDVRLDPGDALLRGGPFTIQPIWYGDWSEAPPAWTRAASRFADTLSRRGGDLVRAFHGMAGDPQRTVANDCGDESEVPSLPWSALGALLAAVVLVGGARGRARPDLAVSVALFALAAALRLTFGPFAPLHVNGQGPAWLLAAWGRTEGLRPYGPGYGDLFGTVTRLLPDGPPDRAVFVANALLSAIWAPLLFVLGRAAGLSRKDAAIAGGLVVVDPVGIATGATESVHPAVGALALTAAALATRTAAGTATRRALACFGAASAIAAAARIHPLAWPVLAVAPLGALLPGAAIGRRVAGAGIVSALAAGLLAATSWAPLSAVLMSMRTMTGADGLLGGDSLTAPPFSAWLIAAMVLAVCRRIGPIPTRFALPAIAASLALAATGATFEQSPIWAAAYARLFAPFPLLLAVAAATALPRRALALAIALSVPGLWLTAPLAPETTEQAEYRALRAAFDDLPDGCVVTWLGRVDDRLLSLPVAGLPGWARGTDPDRVFDARGGSLGTGRCALWVHGSLCESAPGRPVCERVEAGTRLRLRASWELPAEPSYRGFDYLANTVPIAIYDVLGAAQ